MKRLSFGFIDPLSLITLGVLTVGLVITTFIVKNPDINLDIRKMAAVGELCKTMAAWSAMPPAKTVKARS